MKITVVRKDGQAFSCSDQLAENVVDAYRQRKDIIISLDGHDFSAREIKEIIDLDKQETTTSVQSCGKCLDGMQSITTIDDKDYAVPCECHLGDKYQEMVKFKKGIPANKVKEIMTPTSKLDLPLQQFKDNDKEYAEMKQILLDTLKLWTRTSPAERADIKEYYDNACKMLSARGLELELEKQFYGK